MPTADGRHLEVVTSGPEDALPLVYISGTPTGAAYVPDIAEAAVGVGWRYICYSRPGYAGSTT